MIHKMYNCSKPCKLKDSDCPGNGFVNKDCKCMCPGKPIQSCKSTTKPKKGNCEDLHHSCSFWAAQGECGKNPKFMLKNCKLSCKACNDQISKKIYKYIKPKSS